MTHAAGEKHIRLLGFERVVLKAGESRNVTVTVEPRLLARIDGKNGLGQGGRSVWHSASPPAISSRRPR